MIFSLLKNEQIAATAKASFREFFFSRSHDAVIRVYDETGNVIETHEQASDFKVW